MSGHERERVSAYLDGELGPAERAEVEAHLAVCAACAALLEDLAAVGAEAAGLPAAAPEGYFDRFPSRVVARLRAADARRRPFRLPVWTWAAAAALVLAAVTPLTLRGRRAPAAPATGADIQAVPRGAAPFEAVRGPAARLPTGTPSPAPAGTTAPLSSPSFPAAPPAKAGKRVVRGEPSPEEEEKEAAARPAVLDRAGPAPARDVVAADATREREEIERPLPDANAIPVSAGGPATLARSAAAPAAAPAEASAPAVKGMRSPALAIADEEGRAFRRLDATHPSSTEEWRRLREAWLAFAAAHPADRRADEARVRAIEAGREAWLAGGSAADEEAFRRDAAAYLAAETSLQKQRVERLLATPGP